MSDSYFLVGSNLEKCCGYSRIEEIPDGRTWSDWGL